jgi:hypothetical protein
LRCPYVIHFIFEVFLCFLLPAFYVKFIALFLGQYLRTNPKQ